MNKVVGGGLAVVAGTALALAVPAEANAATLIGAMAFSQNTQAFGWGTGPTWQAAEDAAFHQCQTANLAAFDCTAVGWIPSGCAALVSNGQNWVAGRGPTQDAATQDANQQLPGGQVISAQCLPGS
jgi:hypothetical protein